VQSWLDIPSGMKRINPQSVRRVLFDLLVNEYGADAVQLERHISEVFERMPQKDRRRYHVPMKAEWIYQATRDGKKIEYGHLELLSRTLGIPTALLLLYTRVLSDLESDENTRADKSLRVLYAFRSSTDALIEAVEAMRSGDEDSKSGLSFNNFVNIRQTYLNKFDGELFV
jgi:hypothetical protein